MYYYFDAVSGPVRWIGKDYQEQYWEENSIWWISGQRFADGLINEPLKFELEPIKDTWDHGPHMPQFLKGARMPVWRDDLVEAMRDAGVDNLDAYAVQISTPEGTELYENYKAVNIIGLIAAADMEKSSFEIHDNIPLVDVSFDKLVLDESKTHGALIFRLAENATTILVHEKLMNYLESKPIKNLDYLPLETVGII